MNLIILVYLMLCAQIAVLLIKFLLLSAVCSAVAIGLYRKCCSYVEEKKYEKKFTHRNYEKLEFFGHIYI